MRVRFVLLALILGVSGLVPGNAAPAPQTTGPEKIAQLIERMGSADFTERENANLQLEAIGVPALESLRKATKSDDPEIRRRAEELVGKLERRAATEKALAPKKVRLTFKETPLLEALLSLHKQSGFDIELQDPEGKLKSRTVTLDTGEVSFWEALDSFCLKAGLVEVDNVINGAVPPNPANFRQGAKLRPAIGPAPVQAAPIQAVQPAILPAAPPLGLPRANVAAPSVSVIRLADGKAKPIPTAYAGALRIRALPNAIPARDGENNVQINLQVSREPRLLWHDLPSVRIEKAVDASGELLSPLLFGADGVNQAMPVRMIGFAGFNGNLSQVVPVHLKRGEKPVGELKELTGVLSATLASAPEAVLIMDKILEASGKTVKGAEGGFFKIVEVKKLANGTITVQFEFEPPPNAVPALAQPQVPMLNGVPIQVFPVPLPPGKPIPLPAPRQGKGAAVPGKAVQVQAQVPVQAQAEVPVPIQVQAQPIQVQGPIQVQIQGRAQIAVAVGGIRRAWNVSHDGIVLQDDKGAAFALVGSGIALRQDAQGLKQTITMTFQPAKDQGAPQRLVYLASKQIKVEVPFTLKNVPLR